MGVLFALIAASAYGISDFVGGFASRRVSALNVLLVSYPVGTGLMAATLPFFAGPLSARTLTWSLVGGVTGLAGVALMYSALAIAPMNIISPVTAVMSAAVPVLGGVLRGERPAALAWLGIVLGMVAVVFISRQPADHPHPPPGWRPLLMAVLAGVGFGSYFICLASTDHNSGVWPVVLSRLCSSVLVLPLLLTVDRYVRPSAGVFALAAVAGGLDAAANLAFLLSSRHGLLSLAGVITALYPAGTVLLAMAILKERTGTVQRAGLAMAAVSVVLLTR